MSQKINGFQIREAINRWELQRTTASQQFAETLFAFEDEAKAAPKDVMALYETADLNVAKLKAIQQRFNNNVMCDVQGKKVPMNVCVNLVEGAGRREKMWREATVGKRDRYYRSEEKRERSKDTEYAKRQLPLEECAKLAADAAKYASAVRNAISRGNSTEVTCESIGISETDYKAIFE